MDWGVLFVRPRQQWDLGDRLAPITLVDGAMLRRTRHFRVVHTWKQERVIMKSGLAPVARCKSSQRWGDADNVRGNGNQVVAKWKRSNRHARPALGGRVGSRSATARTARWARHRSQVRTAIV